MWPKTYEGYYLLEFVAAEDADIRVVIWRAVPQGELFVRRSRNKCRAKGLRIGHYEVRCRIGVCSIS